MTPSAWKPVDEAASAWKPVAAEKPAPYDAKTRGAKMKGTPEGFDDSFMGTISKDLASLPEGVYNAATHPVDTLKGAFRQLLNLPGDVVTDISKGNWGKLAAKTAELAVPAMSTERGAAAVANAAEKVAPVVKAAASIPAKAGGAVLDAATAPGTRDVIGMFSPRAGKALDLAAKIRNAVEKTKGAAPEATPAAAETPGQVLAKESGTDWAKLSASDQATLEQVAKSRATAAERNTSTMKPPPPRQEVIPQTQPVAAEAGAPSMTIEQQLRADMEAQRAAQPPAPAAPQPVIGAQVPQPLPMRGSPVRPPLASPTATATPSANGIIATVPEGAVQTAGPAARTLAQTEAAMAQKGAPPLEAPRSQYTASGELKSPQLRAAEITAANRTAKAQRFAKALHEAGVESTDAVKIESGVLAESQMQQGAMPRWGNIAAQLGEKDPSALSIPEIIKSLRELEKQKAAPAKPAEAAQPAAKPIGKMTRSEIAQKAGLPENATTEQIMQALAKEMGK